MKKILYFALLAVGLQSCLKDKENEGEIFNGVDKDKNVLIFSTLVKAPKTNYQIASTNINGVAEVVLPSIGVVLKPGAQTFQIPVELPIRALKEDVIVNATYDVGKIAPYNAARVVEYNDAKAKYDVLKAAYEAAVIAGVLPLPAVPVAPPLFNPFIPLPTGKYTLSPSVTIKAGTQIANLTFTLNNPVVDLSLLSRYMLPITLSTTSNVSVSFPTSLIVVEGKKFSPYAGLFIGVGTSTLFTGTTPSNFLWDDFEYSWTIPRTGPSANCAACVELPFGAGLNRVTIPLPLIQFNFNYNAADPSASTMTAGQAFGGTIGISAAPLNSNPEIVGVPRLRFDNDGVLLSIKNLSYKYTNGAGNLRLAVLDSVYRVVE